MSRDIKKEMMELLGGEFLEWYSNLNDEEKQQYKIEFNKLQDNDIPHSEFRRMESEGVYEEKFQRNSPSPTYFNDEWNKGHTSDMGKIIDIVKDWDTTLQDGLEDNEAFEIDNKDVEQLVFDESHALDMVMNDMVSDMDIQDFENDDVYEDGVDERPIKKEVDYNDDEFDY